MGSKHLTVALIIGQAIAALVLLDWIFHESQANPFMQVWFSSISPALLGNEWVILWFSGALVVSAGILLWGRLRARSARRLIDSNRPAKGFAKTPTRGLAKGETVSPPLSQAVYEVAEARTASEGELEPQPFYLTLKTRTLVLFLSEATLGISLWFVTLATFRISEFAAHSFFYVSSLPFTYWGGLIATIALFLSRGFAKGKGRTVLEMGSLFLLALYLIGLPSFAYEDPRILDSFQHEGNGLGLISNGGWFHAPIWYLRQFPGAFTYFAQLNLVAGVDPFQAMKYYPLALTFVLVLFVYVIARTYSSNYAVLASGLFLTGMWFQLHVSPQSLELIPYLGILFATMKMITERANERRWASVAMAVAPTFVASHPETPLVVVAGLTIFLAFSLPRSRRMFKSLMPTVGALLLTVLAFVTLWWGTVASEARRFVSSSLLSRALAGLFRLAPGTSTIPTSPSYSYHITILLEQGVSVLVWMSGLFLLLFIRRFRLMDNLFAGFFLAGISTIPIALFGQADVLQRSYLFALFPAALLTVSMIERRDAFSVRGKSLSSLLKVTLLIFIIGFSLLIPITRYGVDPAEYIPRSSLQASDVVSNLHDFSILFLRPGEFGWRFYADLKGDNQAPKVEQANIATTPGGYTKLTSNVGNFNLTFTRTDAKSNYIMVSDYYENLYHLRFGSSGSEPYLYQKSLFETQTALGTGFSRPFNLVYSTGTDRIYENRDLG